MKNIFLSVFCTLVLIAPAKLFASEIESEFSFHISRTTFFNWIQQQLSTLKTQQLSRDFQYDNYALPESGITVQNMKAHLEGEITDLTSSDQDWSLGLKSTQLNLSLHTDEITIKKMIEVNQPGFHGQFQLEARCQNINVSVVGTMSVNALLKSEADILTLHLHNLDWQSYPSTLQMSIEACSGAEGFGDIIQQEIRNNLVFKINYFSASIEQYLRDQLGFYQQWKKVQDKNPKITYWSMVDKLKLSADSVNLYGYLHATFNDGKQNSIQNYKLNSPNTDSNSRDPQLKVPSQFLIRLAQLNMLTQVMGAEFKSSDISAFTSLMHSRFLQFFIWPDLMNFSKKSVFLMRPIPQVEPQITIVKDSWNLAWNLPTVLWGPRDGQYQKILSLQSSLSGKVSLVQDKGHLYLRSQMASSNYKIKWDQDYVSKYDPSTRISKSLLYSGLDQMLNQNQLNWEIPVLQILPNLRLQAQTPQLLNQDYVLNFKVLP